MIVFTKIKWKNFLSTGNSFLEIDLNKHKSTIITGKNGAGKSQFLDAISFALYGKAFRKINKPQLINSINNKNCVVECEFINNNTSYKIVRGLKPSIFEVYVDGQLNHQLANSSEQQKQFENEILKISHKNFCQLICISVSNYSCFFDLNADMRRNLIEDVLGLSAFSKLQKEFKEEYYIIDNEKKQLNNSIQLLDNEIKKNENDIKWIYQTIESNKNKQLIEVNEDINQREIEVKSKEKELFDLLEIFKDKNIDLVKISYEKNMKDKQENERNLSIIQTKTNELQKQIKFFKSFTSCPTCKQTIEETKKIKICEEISNEIVKFDDEQTRIKTNIDKLEKNDIVNSFKEMQHYLEVCNNKVVEINKTISIIKQNIHQLKTKKEQNIIPEGLEDKIYILQNSINELEIKRQKIYEEMINNNERNELYSILVDCFNDSKENNLKSYILNQYIPLINQYINQYLQIFNFFIHFEFDNYFQETIKSRFRDNFSYYNFSEGEKTRIDIALLFTWRMIASIKSRINCNILIIDEILDSSMDVEGIENFISLLNEQSNNQLNTFIISHKIDNIVDGFDHFIKMEKQDNFTTILS